MQTYLGLGSNIGDRRECLRRGIAALEENGVAVQRVSPVVESPALLPPDAPSDWNLPFLNIVIDAQTQDEPQALRETIKGIEQSLGPREGNRWSPRALDIDILLWGDEHIETEVLTIPHRDVHKRSFVLTPLVALAPQLRLPGRPEKTVLDWSRSLSEHIPLWMGIVNVTPDSFSDGGTFMDWGAVQPHVEAMLDAGVNIVDVGAESTRPGAVPITADEEWRRLEPVLAPLQERLSGDPLRPRVSVDTYHPETARLALERDIDIINDVSGLTNPAMIELAKSSRADWVAMHSLGVPVDKQRTLPVGENASAAVESWLVERLEDWDNAGLDLNRVIFDPGIGFGKDGLQSLELLRAAGRFRRFGVRVLVGHSRKSFFGNLTGASAEDRDLATVGASLALCEQGIDILRVHNVPLHAEAYRGWSHVSDGG
ncbi:MAG: dihydropteroate synthase [Gammaproteobacteria bacterium]|nr:dihydropteroate synthase [Gammaproteobacteria bacterium]